MVGSDIKKIFFCFKLKKNNIPWFKFLFISLIGIGLTLPERNLRSQDFLDARGLGLAGSHLAITEGTEFVGGNPATLAKRRSFNFELHLISAHLMLKNNSYSLKDYDRYFTTGDTLTSADIDKLFDQIPDDGLQADADIGLKTFSLYTYPFGLSIYGLAGGYANVPKEPLQLPFYGNKVLRKIRLNDLDGEAWAAVAVQIGIAFPLTQYFSEHFDFVAIGLAPKYLFGVQYAGIESASGQFITEDTYFLADGHLEAKTSKGGRGLGIDLGFLAEYREKWTFSLNFSNLLGSIRWKSENEQYLFDFESDTIRVNDLDSLETNEIDTTYSIGDFSTGLPRVMTFATAFQYRPNLIFTAAWRQGVNKSLGNFTKPLISVGTEYRPVRALPLRMGMAVGGRNGFALGLGGGIDLNYWQLNIGYLNHNFRWFRSARSIELAVTTQFRF
ncbi:MAG: hypothetical protein Kow0042_10020 [Calditrichia bacterium]